MWVTIVFTEIWVSIVHGPSRKLLAIFLRFYFKKSGWFSSFHFLFIKRWRCCKSQWGSNLCGVPIFLKSTIDYRLLIFFKADHRLSILGKFKRRPSTIELWDRWSTHVSTFEANMSSERSKRRKILAFTQWVRPEWHESQISGGPAPRDANIIRPGQARPGRRFCLAG